MRRPRMNARSRYLLRPLLAAGLALLLIPASVPGQPCMSMTRGVNCGTPSSGSVSDPRPVDGGRPEQYRTFQSLGSELNFAGEQPATFGAITFSGGSTRCSGLFRTTRC